MCPWLREFEAPIWRPDVKDHRKIPWDWMPADWTGDDRAYRRDQWFEMEPLAEGNVKQEYDRVTGSLTGFWSATATGGRGDTIRRSVPTGTRWPCSAISEWNACC